MVAARAAVTGRCRALATDLSRSTRRSASLAALFAGGLIALVAAVVLSFFVSRALLRPLHAFRAALARIAAGDLGARVRWRSNDELGASRARSTGWPKSSNGARRRSSPSAIASPRCCA
jgi:methyl-accepting chemotaxis protein